MHFEVYTSSAVKPFSKDELVELLRHSREKNIRLGVTGMLLYKDGNFMQALEGEESVVRKLSATIERDPRHRNFFRLIRGKLDERHFPDWSMGFRELNSQALTNLEGFNEFLNTPLTATAFAGDPNRAQRLLLTFKRSM